MFKPAPLPDGLPNGSFTLRAARALGVTDSRARASDLYIPSREIRVPRRVPQPLLDRVRPYLKLLPDAAASHTTAAALHRIPLPLRHSSEPFLHLTRPAGRTISRRRG
ncbi:hypothetical protein ACQCSX_07630 [Pseudarthrobacter sp. P1]|uniref:hypothetical protein n=1 Tax=Pseudarthrobacter sp. P1 TaxID=3418418 RepID=UPI003CE777EA